jgi:hypothetical protein
VASENAQRCIFDGCPKEGRAKKGGLCDGHHWQKMQGRSLTPLRARGRPRWDVFLDAMYHYIDVESEAAGDSDLERAEKRLKMAGRRFFGDSDVLHG